MKLSDLLNEDDGDDLMLFEKGEKEDQRFVALINQGKYTEAVLFLESEALNKNVSMQYWFSNQYRNSDNQSHWNDFFSHAVSSKKYAENLFSAFSACVDVAKSDELTKNIIDILLNKFNSVKKSSLFSSMMDSIKPNKLYGFLLDKMDSVNPKLRKDLYEQFVQFLEETANFNLLEKTKKRYYDKLEKKDISELKETDKDYLSVTLLKEFQNAFDDPISYAGGLAACAAIRDKKKNYDFNPTVLNEFEEFTKYVAYLKTLSCPLRERFLFSSTHWVCGDIMIDKNGKANLFLVDSLGSGSELDTTDILATRFSDIFKQANIYTAETQTQNSESSCSMFSLDTLRHLFTVENYIKQNLFDYLEAHITGKFSLPSVTKNANQKVEVKVCLAPLSLERTQQSSKFIEENLKNRTDQEKKQAVNKRGEDAETSFNKLFIFNKEKNKKINTRLNYKIDKLALLVEDFLKKYDTTTLFAMMKHASLAGFIERNKKHQIKQSSATIYAALHQAEHKMSDKDFIRQLLEEDNDEMSVFSEMEKEEQEKEKQEKETIQKLVAEEKDETPLTPTESQILKGILKEEQEKEKQEKEVIQKFVAEEKDETPLTPTESQILKGILEEEQEELPSKHQSRI